MPPDQAGGLPNDTELWRIFNEVYSRAGASFSIHGGVFVQSALQFLPDANKELLKVVVEAAFREGYSLCYAEHLGSNPRYDKIE